ncbi:hypothetical protein RD792_008687 [Penstemon davidsonii]|uniref:Uncharacterized protein n=1 Tax=Penstemon davidsonii TaxID=160366 RepID=A0ABR0DAL3_9LAMI|nr:hypothetical protein RD792_008687 [Penstemon davidsonii]
MNTRDCCTGCAGVNNVYYCSNPIRRVTPVPVDNTNVVKTNPQTVKKEENISYGTAAANVVVPKTTFTVKKEEPVKVTKNQFNTNMAVELGCVKWMALIAIILGARVIMAEESSPQAQFTAMFAFGDSLTDPGNNNYLNSLAKANYVPYGVDFYQGPSGRFCNGRTIIDYIGDLVGIPALLPYTSCSASATLKDILRGVNYASAAGGILEETGQNLGERFSFSRQVKNFENTLSQLRSQMEDEKLRNYLAKALVIMILGSNDYINNYLNPSFYPSSFIYSPKEYADLLVNRYATQILALQSLGLRKFFIAGIAPLGCIPNQIANGLPPPGKCVDYTNGIVGMYNKQLESLVNELNDKFSNGSIFAYGNTFGAFTDILNNSKSYGFSVTDRGCCGIGRNQGQITCLPFSVPCTNRDQYIFWDAFHPTQAVNQIMAQKAYSGSPSDCYPVNIQKMAQLYQT